MILSFTAKPCHMRVRFPLWRRFLFPWRLKVTDFYLILTDGGAVDGISQGAANARREARDLQRMGCEVTMLGPCGGALADEVSDLLERGAVSVSKARRMIRGASL